MNDKVTELVEWVAQECYFGTDPRTHTWEEIKRDYPSLTKAMREMAKSILSHPDLALIDRKPKCWHCGKEIKPSIVHDCGYSTSSFQMVIPLAEALKEK